MNKNSVLIFQENSDPNNFYHIAMDTLDANVKNQLKDINPLIIFSHPDDFDHIIASQFSFLNYDHVEFSRLNDLLDPSFGEPEELFIFLENLINKFFTNFEKDLKSLEQMISHKEEHERVSKEFHRLKSTFATFGLEETRSFIEGLQKQSEEYTMNDLNQLKNYYFGNKNLLINYLNDYKTKGAA